LKSFAYSDKIPPFYYDISSNYIISGSETGVFDKSNVIKNSSKKRRIRFELLQTINRVIIVPNGRSYKKGKGTP
jgi:hypothetical protein